MHLSPPASFSRLAALAITVWLGGVQAEPIDGLLERGPTHSVLWTVSSESGDLIGQVFANASPAGRAILGNCLPGLSCVVENASVIEPPAQLELNFSVNPSGWWLIEQARTAHMAPDLPMSEKSLGTRHGNLAITENPQVLLLDERPVLAPPEPAHPAADTNTARPTPGSARQAGAPPTLPQRIAAWWNELKNMVRHKLSALLGRTVHQPAPGPLAKTNATPDHSPRSGTIEAVWSPLALHIVAHFELDKQDIVLLQNVTGAAGCPSLYRFATLTPQGIAVTPEFGTCSDIAHITLLQGKNGATEPLLTMNGFLGTSSPIEDRERAHREVHQFVLRQGQVRELQEPLP